MNYTAGELRTDTVISSLFLYPTNPPSGHSSPISIAYNVKTLTCVSYLDTDRNERWRYYCDSRCQLYKNQPDGREDSKKLSQGMLR